MRTASSILCAFIFLTGGGLFPSFVEALGEERPFVIDPEVLQKANEPEIDLENRTAVEFATLDYPDIHLPWIRKQLVELDSKQKPVAWTRACWALSSVDRVEDQGPILDILEKCIQLALENHLYLEWTSLSYNLANYHRTENDFAGYSEKIKIVISQTREHNDPDALAFILAAFSIDLMRMRILDASLPFLAEAVKLIDTHRSHSVLSYSLTKNALGNSLRYRELHEEAKALDKILIKAYSDQKIRILMARNNYSLGFSLLYQEVPDIQGSKLAMIEAMRLATEVNDRSLQGSILSSLSLISSRQGAHQDAVKQAEKSVELFASEGEQITMAHSQKRLSEVLVNKGDYQRALLEMNEAVKNMLDDNKVFKKEILWLRYKSYAGLKDKSNALAYLEEYTGLAETLAKQREKNEYNRAAASLGLQLEQEKTKSLIQENKLQLQKLTEAERFRIFVVVLGILSLSTLGLLLLSFRQIQKIHASKRQIQIILDNIDEGLLTVDRQQTIGRDYSKHMTEIVDASTLVSGQDFVRTIFDSSHLPGEQKSMIREILGATLGETSLAWELNADNLPGEVRMGVKGEKTFTIRWIPVFDKHGIFERLLVKLTDITQARELEKALGAQEKKLRALPETLREILHVRVDRMNQVLLRTEETLKQLENPENLATILREIHTHKGEARTLGLRGLSQTLHELESDLLVQNKTAPIQENFQDNLRSARDRILEYRSFAEILYQGRTRSEALHDSWLASAIDPHLDAWKKQLKSAELPLQEIRVIDGVSDWSLVNLSILQELCLHAVNNSLDHGFVFPKQKGKLIRRPIIEIAAFESKDKLRIEIRDNGVGLDLGHLKVLAANRGFVPAAHESIADILFQDGVSTAENLTLTSGRGVGLAAVKASVIEQGGTIGIQNNDQDFGTLLWAELPLTSR